MHPYAGKPEDGVSPLLVGSYVHTMAERPIKLSSQQDTDPAECVTVKRKQCSDGHSQMVPAALQLQVHTPEPTLEEKLEMVKKMKCEAADIFILMHRISEGE